MTLSRDQLLSKNGQAIEKVPLRGDCVYVRRMTADERDEWEVGQYLVNGKDVSVNRRQLRARLILRCICDEHGARLLADTDLAAVGAMDSDEADLLYEVAQRLNRLRAEDVDDLEKNSEGGLAANSS